MCLNKWLYNELLFKSISKNFNVNQLWKTINRPVKWFFQFVINLKFAVIDFRFPLIYKMLFSLLFNDLLNDLHCRFCNQIIKLKNRLTVSHWLTDLKRTVLLVMILSQKLRLTNLTSEKGNRKRELYLQAAENLTTSTWLTALE